jgi:ubiquinone biosynthesis protein
MGMLSIRKISVIGRTYRHLNRYRQILSVFIRYGFGDLVTHLKIDEYLESGRQIITRSRNERIEKLTRSERVRMACEELGPTYVKLGQVLSTRPDLVPDEFVKEFSKLQDQVAPFDSQDAKKIVERELGRPTEEVFTTFEKDPIASASIGQVHKAVTTDGDVVAVKVQRPGIRKIIEVDLEIMLHLATLMERHVEEIALHRPVKIVEEFTRVLEKEIDYQIEASNTQRVARQFLDDPNVYIPKVYTEISTTNILVTEFIDGIRVKQLAESVPDGLDRKIVVDRGAEICLKQIFEFGFFHADPHPGNIFVLPGNVVCLLDFGMMGTLDRLTRETLVDLINAVVQRDAPEVSRVILKLTSWEDEPDRRLLEKDVAGFIGRHLPETLKDIEIGRMLQDIVAVVAQHRLSLPPDIFLMAKALGAIEGLGRMLDPDFDMVAKAAPFLMKIKFARYHPDRVTGDMIRIGADLLQFIHQFPEDVLEIGRQVKKKQLVLNLRNAGLERTLAAHHQISNRLSFSIIIAALIVGSALIVISATPPLFYGISLIGIILFLAAAIMGIWLLVAIISKGRL